MPLFCNAHDGLGTEGSLGGMLGNVHVIHALVTSTSSTHWYGVRKFVDRFRRPPWRLFHSSGFPLFPLLYLSFASILNFWNIFQQEVRSYLLPLQAWLP